MSQRLSSLFSDYIPPHPNFDRSKVKGLVATLTSISPQHWNKATALEVAAGRKLYNVVEDDHVSKELLQHGKLKKKRVITIPLDQINASTLTAQPVPWLMLLVTPSFVRTRSWPITLSGAAPVCVEFWHGRKNLGGRAKARWGRERELERGGCTREKWKALQRELDIREHEAKLAEEQLGGSNAANKEEKISQSKGEIFKKKAALLKQAIMAKTQQKEHQTAGFSSSVDAHVAKLQKDVDKLLGKVKEVVVCRSVGILSFLPYTNEPTRPSVPVRLLSSLLNGQCLPTLITMKSHEEVLCERKDAVDEVDLSVKRREKVDCDFSGISAELLPGKSAKLQLPKGQDVMQCLEVGDQLST
ncbi:hypothetical protein EDC04DRAFT_2607075 [Pisolithus marmoratus]|nr:hypothetical protein EDC04DRAFT_2607075 [Pisolithus marmoratus]